MIEQPSGLCFPRQNKEKS